MFSHNTKCLIQYDILDLFFSFRVLSCRLNKYAYILSSKKNHAVPLTGHLPLGGILPNMNQSNQTSTQNVTAEHTSLHMHHSSSRDFHRMLSDDGIPPYEPDENEVVKDIDALFMSDAIFSSTYASSVHSYLQQLEVFIILFFLYENNICFISLFYFFPPSSEERWLPFKRLHRATTTNDYNRSREIRELNG